MVSFQFFGLFIYFFLLSGECFSVARPTLFSQWLQTQSGVLDIQNVWNYIYKHTYILYSNLATCPIVLSQVVKTVYASPSRVNFQLDSKKASVLIPFIYPFGERRNTIFQKHSYFIDNNTELYTGSGNVTCLSRYMFCNWWFWLHLWCCGNILF